MAFIAILGGAAPSQSSSWLVAEQRRGLGNIGFPPAVAETSGWSAAGLPATWATLSS